MKSLRETRNIICLYNEKDENMKRHRLLFKLSEHLERISSLLGIKTKRRIRPLPTTKLTKSPQGKSGKTSGKRKATTKKRTKARTGTKSRKSGKSNKKTKKKKNDRQPKRATKSAKTEVRHVVVKSFNKSKGRERKSGSINNGK